MSIGTILGKVLAAPIRVLDMPNKMMRAVAGDDDGDPTTADKIAEAIEEQAKEIAG